MKNGALPSLIRLLLFPLFILSHQLSYAQGWVDVGVKVMYGLTGFYNNNIIKDAQHSYNLMGAPSYGGVIGLNLGSAHVLNLEGLFLNNRQKLDFRDNDEKFINEVKWNNLDLYLLYRHYTGNGTHFEIGPKFSLVRSTSQAYAGQLIESEDGYENNYFSGVAGLGGFITGNETMTLKIGLRFEYALSDLISSDGIDAGFPAFYTDYETYTSTRPYRVGVFLEFNFGLGKEGKYICGRRRYVFEW